ncbi:MAG: acyl-CoA thioesterase [Bacteroidia bacterium]|nr:acyl-CoA thioesterase [Bacteroidia bacterium]
MKSEVYEKTIQVKAEHLDALQHVNNVVFLQWVQDIAGEHWLSKSNDAFNQKFYWVVLDHHIEYKGQAFLSDSIIVKTYVERNEGVRSLRVVEFFNNDKCIVKAKTNWCLIDKARQRPTRVPKEVDEMFFH